MATSLSLYGDFSVPVWRSYGNCSFSDARKTRQNRCLVSNIIYLIPVSRCGCGRESFDDNNSYYRASWATQSWTVFGMSWMPGAVSTLSSASVVNVSAYWRGSTWSGFPCRSDQDLQLPGGIHNVEALCQTYHGRFDSRFQWHQKLEALFVDIHGRLLDHLQLICSVRDMLSHDVNVDLHAYLRAMLVVREHTVRFSSETRIFVHIHRATHWQVRFPIFTTLTVA